MQQALIGQLAAEIDRLRAAVEHTREEVKSAPGRLVSRFDSSRTELGWLADGQKALLTARENELARLRLAPTPTACDSVHEGALVCLQPNSDGKQRLWFLVCNAAAGSELCVGGEVVTILTASSPLARAAWQRRAGDRVILNASRAFTVETVL